MSEPRQIAGFWAFPPEWVDARLAEAMERVEMALAELDDSEQARAIWADLKSRTGVHIAQLLIAPEGTQH